MKRIKPYALALLLIFLFSGCEKAFDIYIGMPLQPKSINSEFVPGLNIFGILKAGPSYDSLNHFFEVQRLLAPSDSLELIDINEAEIYLEFLSGSASQESYSLYNYGDGYYSNDEISPNFGEVWTYECSFDTFHITSTTLIPNEPQLVEGSLKKSVTNLNFMIQADSTAYLYEVFYFNETDFVFERINPFGDDPTKVNLSLKSGLTVGSILFVFAYDKNYEKYISTSNIFYKPNAFRPRYTSVEGGYGCFCSTASLQVIL